MIELEKGIYRYGEELKNSGEKPLVLIHPWYDEKCNPFFVYSRARNRAPSRINKDYKNNLDSLLVASCGRAVFLFEVFPVENVLESCERIAEKRGSAGLYGICTEERDPFPEYSSTEEVLEFIRNFSGDVDLAGGYIREFEGEYKGCAGAAYASLLKSGFRVDLVEDCCFG